MARGLGLVFLIILGCVGFSGCQTASQQVKSQKREGQGSFLLKDARARLSSSQLPNGGLGWVSVSVPVVGDVGAGESFEVSGILPSVVKSEEDPQVSEKPAVKKVVLHFFESPASELGSSSGTSRVYSALIPIPYDRGPGAAEVLVTLKTADQVRQLEVPFEVVSGKYPSETLRVDPSRVHPSAKDLPRIAREVKEIGAAYRSTQLTKFWKGPFELPIRSDVTSRFGTRRVYNGSLKGFHSGLDLRAGVGTPIRSAAAGRVVLAKDLFFTGNTVILDHGFGVMTLYAHLSELKVQVGELVGSKYLLGLSGQTGRVNGPHLHWQAVIDGVKVNPEGLLQAQFP